MKIPNKMPIIRPAVLSDAEAIEKCVEASYSHYISRIGKPPGPMLDNYSDVILDQSVFVAKTGKKIIGIVVLIQTATNILLDNVAVHPDQQGKGLGRHLMGFAESEATSNGFKTLDLYTHECMNENIEFYSSIGYIETKRKKEKGYKRVYMQKNLSETKR